MKKEKAYKIIREYGFNPIEELTDNVDIRNQKINLIDSDGYKYYLSVGNLKDDRGSHAIVKSFNPYSIENIQTFIYNNGGNAKVLSKEWSDADTKISLQCEKCGKEYKAIWHHIYSNHKFKCNKCSKTSEWCRKPIDDVIKLCRKHGYKLIDDTYISRKNFDIQDKYGYKYSNVSVYTLDKMTNKFNRFNYRNKYQIENMRIYVKLNDLPIVFVHDNQQNVKKDDYIECYCCDCGEIYRAYWEQLIATGKNNHPRIRCQVCTGRKSNLEYLVEEYLKSKNVIYHYQQRFKWCKNIRELPFDFYLDDYNTVIEVNGTQHYYESQMFGTSLQEQQKIDGYKKQCCINHNVNYVAIPYWLIVQSKCETYKNIIDNIIG